MIPKPRCTPQPYLIRETGFDFSLNLSSIHPFCDVLVLNSEKPLQVKVFVGGRRIQFQLLTS